MLLSSEVHEQKHHDYVELLYLKSIFTLDKESSSYFSHREHSEKDLKFSVASPAAANGFLIDGRSQPQFFPWTRSLPLSIFLQKAHAVQFEIHRANQRGVVESS